MKAIAAMAANRAIGSKGGIPWHIPADFKWFKEFTIGKTLVIGRTTFETLPPLKDRKFIVLSSSGFDLTVGKFMAWSKRTQDVSFCDPLRFKPSDYPDTIVAGGAKTYELLLPYCDSLFMTHVIDEYEGDTFMPEFESLFPNSEVIKEDKEFWIVRYWK